MELKRTVYCLITRCWTEGKKLDIHDKICPACVACIAQGIMPTIAQSRRMTFAQCLIFDNMQTIIATRSSLVSKSQSLLAGWLRAWVFVHGIVSGGDPSVS